MTWTVLPRRMLLQTQLPGPRTQKLRRRAETGIPTEGETMTKCTNYHCEEEATQIFIDRVKDRNPYNRSIYKDRKTPFCDKHIKDRWILVWKIEKTALIIAALITIPLWLPYLAYKIEQEKRQDSVIWADVKKKPIEEVKQ